jgi:bifunctional enzyme CysN/CysC
MATAAAGAHVVILVLDASAGIKAQTLRHLNISVRLGVKRFVVVANKIDLVDYSSKVFRSLEAQVAEMFTAYPGVEWSVIPASGTAGFNVVKRGAKMRWYTGPTILEMLDRTPPDIAVENPPSLAVQMVQRIGNRQRRYFGSVLRGQVHNGLELTIFPAAVSGTLMNLSSSGAETESAEAGLEVAFEIQEERDIERGALLSLDPTLVVSHQWDATVIWLEADEGIIGRPYLAKVGYQSHRVTISRATTVALDGVPSTENRQVLEPNGTYRVTVSAQGDFTLAPFDSFPEAGRFILVNPETGQTAAVGLVNYSLRRSDNVTPHRFSLNQETRESLAGGSGKVVWLTGLSGSGKSSIADHASQLLTSAGRIVSILDGDNLRTGLNSDLGFTEADRVENIRRTAEVARLMADSGTVVLVSLISPYRQDRARAKEIIGAERFHEVFISTPLEVCESRDPKGLYKKARAGDIPNFTGVDAPYETPVTPDLVIDGAGDLTEQSERVLALVHG